MGYAGEAVARYVGQPMTLEAATIALLLELRVPEEDRLEVDRQARIEVLGRSVARAAMRATCSGDYTGPECKPIYWDDIGLAARMVAIGEHESLFRRRIHAGECLVHECDSRVWHGVRVFFAQGPWQAHRIAALPLSEWRAMVGVEQVPTDAMAWYSTKLLVMQEYRCHRGAAGGFAGYATGNKCQWSGADKLVRNAARYRVFLVNHVKDQT